MQNYMLPWNSFITCVLVSDSQKYWWWCQNSWAQWANKLVRGEGRWFRTQDSGFCFFVPETVTLWPLCKSTVFMGCWKIDLHLTLNLLHAGCYFMDYCILDFMYGGCWHSGNDKITMRLAHEMPAAYINRTWIMSPLLTIYVELLLTRKESRLKQLGQELIVGASLTDHNAWFWLMQASLQREFQLTNYLFQCLDRGWK